MTGEGTSLSSNARLGCLVELDWSMRKTELEKRIAALARASGVTWGFDRAGANHDVYRFNGKTIPIPRHREIGEDLAKTILKQCRSTL